MQLRGCQSSARQNKVLQGRQLAVHLVDPGLQIVSVFCIKGRVGQLLLVLIFVRGAGRRHMRAHVDESGLDLFELLVMGVLRGLLFSRNHARVVVSCQAQVRVELVNAAKRLENCMVLVEPIPREQHCRALVPRLRVNLEPLRHRSSLLLNLQQKKWCW